MNWMKFRPFYFALSACVILVGLFSVIRWGFNFDIDFTGGSVVELRLSPSDSDKLKTVLGADYQLHQLTQNKDIFTLKVQPISQDQFTNLKTQLSQNFDMVEEISFTTVGPSIGKQLIRKTLVATALAAGSILFFVARAFKSLKYGLSAVLAMIHDILVLLGTFSLLSHFFNAPVDLLFVTALLTTLSFSVHDTIVVFDRIRELSRTQKNLSLTTLANQALTETMVRSINNSVTIVLMLLALVLLGGSSIHWFAVALLIGAITGTYSSPFIAVPLLITFDKLLKTK